ncbi:hypothetical protein KC19_1G083500 [Ceratodon purpureus]|uniref:Uncharacterized protein n=1 Tax=Ceratodon purpureus TaxID=3225 RepID=A0A8T0J3S5_CERPU|nr:hypothetical protein KC19_1G083500 [Ceratodon purpureus]
MTSKRGASGENAIDRVGISWRMNTSTGKPTCVVEMRLPKSGWRLHFGSHPHEHEAMIARDYAAFLRHSAGEKGTSAGGFNVENTLYEFEESPVIFESMETSKVRRDEYKRLHTLHEPWQDQLQSGGGPGGFKPKPGGNSPYKELCKAARDDIDVAIKEFRRRRPDLWLVKCRTTTGKESQKVDGSVVREMDLTSPSSNVEVIGSSKSVQSSIMADDKQKVRSLEVDQVMLGADEYPKEVFSSSIGTSNYLSSSPGGKSSHVTRGFNVNQETTPLIKEDSKHKGKEVLKSPLHELVELERRIKSSEHYSSLADFTEDYPSFELENFPEDFSNSDDFDDTAVSMAGTSITYSAAPSNMSAGTSVEDETGLSSNKCNNYHQELVQNEREVLPCYGEPNLSCVEMGEAADHDQSRVQSECHFLNEGQDEMPWAWPSPQTEFEEFSFPDCEGEDSIEHLPQATIANEEVKMDMQIQPSFTIPIISDKVPESCWAPGHMPAATPHSTVEVGRAGPVSKVVVLKKVVSKVASNKARSKAEMVEKRFKSSSSLARGYSAAAAHTQALFAARLEAEKVKLDSAVQRNNMVKIANLTTAKDNGVISNEVYREKVKALLGL